MTSQDGDLEANWSYGKRSRKFTTTGEVGRFTIIGNEIFIAAFGPHSPGGGGPDFYDYAGHLTADGFVLDRGRNHRSLFPDWKTIPEMRFIRHQVGQMKGDADW